MVKKRRHPCSLWSDIIRYVLTIRTVEIAFQVSSGKILLLLGEGGNKIIQTHSFFWKAEEGLLQISSAQPATFSFVWTRFCLWPQYFSFAFSSPVYTLLPVLHSKTASKLAQQTKIVHSDLPNDHQKTSHLPSPEQLWQILALPVVFRGGFTLKHNSGQ